ncbi:hypothetical protein WJX74_002698 [Apatococcus lobatus]|uniref:Amino acid transporter n=1 Tax=Apatococcus lobatus TaxID=904363 RepID=A0AAW1Q9M6_9CHLO
MPAEDTGQSRLLQLGYLQQLPRVLSWQQNAAICISLVSATTGISGLFGIGLAYGGPGSLVWGWLLVSVFTFFTALSMSEICSSLPTAGGIYYWSYMLSGRHGPFAGWFTAHINFVGQVAFVASNEYLCIQLFTTWISLAHLGAETALEHTSVSDTTQSATQQSGGMMPMQTQTAGTAYQGKCTLAWIAIMIIVTPHKQPVQVILTTFQDYESVFYPGNETGGQLPAAQVMWDAFKIRFGSGAGSLLVLAIPVGTSFLSGLFSVTSAARTLYGAARDGSIAVLQPYAAVSSYAKAPVTSVCLVSALAFVPAFSILASPYIFLAVTSIATIGLAFSYAAAIFCRIALARSHFQPGRFNLKRWSYPCGVIAVGWSIFMCIIFSLPPVYPVTMVSFNFSPMALLLVSIWVGATWLCWARFWYKGPAPHICNSDVVKVKPHAWT